MPEIDTPALVNQVLNEAVGRCASDVHCEPLPDGYELRYRVDGLLELVYRLDPAAGRAVVGRLMVMAQLLTYRLDVPQEGRLTLAPGGGSSGGGRTLDCRLAVMPTLHGLRAVVRLPAELSQPRRLEELNLPAMVLEGLRGYAQADSGLLLLTGPAGSGKTTTIYALLEHVAAAAPGLSIISLEDPVERALAGVTQIQVQPFGELSYERALRSILRQDPQVLMLGEIRDAATASLAVQAALSGHRLIATLHAATAAGALARLLEMGIEPYQITSAVYGIVAQRLLRRRDPAGQGYRGRRPAAELARMDQPLRQAVLARADAATIQAAIQRQGGYVSLRQAAQALASAGQTDQAEVARVLGHAAVE